MNVAFSSDRTGFPLIHLIELGYDVHLLPVTKIQFKLFAAADPLFATIYEHASALNPEQDRPATTPRIEQEIMTGLLPEETEKFAIWLDDNDPTSDYTIPNVRQWRDIHDYLQYERCDPHMDYIFENCRHEKSLELVHRILKNQPHTLMELGLMRGGVVEWVQKESNWVGLGSPQASFFPNTFNPLKETIEPVDTTRRMRAFGFRLIRTF